MLIYDAVREFVLDRESAGRTKATIRFYWQNLRRLSEWLAQRGIEEVGDLDRSHIREYFAELHRANLADHTTAAYDRALRVFCSFCVAEGWIATDPMASKPRERPSQDLPDTLEYEEIQCLLQTCDDSPVGRRDRALMLLMLDTGMRAGEVVRMRPKEMCLECDRGRIVIPGKNSKGKVSRTVCVWSETIDALYEWMDIRPPQAGTVFVTCDGTFLTLRPLQPGGLNQMMRRRAKMAGVTGHRKWCHIWRHTFAKSYVLGGGDLETLRRLLGHKSLDTVRIYLGFKVQDLADRHFELSPVRAMFDR